MGSLDELALAKLAQLEDRGLAREVKATLRSAGAKVERDGRTLLSFSCNDYLGLSTDPRVIAAAERALHQFGVGAGAARLVTGGAPIAERLERALAEYLEVERVLLFGSGFLANFGVVPSLVGPSDRIAIDRGSHASLYAGAKASGAELVTFDRRRPESLASVLDARRDHTLVLVEGVHGMDGDRPDLRRLSAIAKARGAWLLVDDAHGLGVVEDGRGSCVDEQGRIPVDLQIGTCSKALGSYGGFVAGTRPVIELLTARARSFVYTTALPPAVHGATLAALEIVAADPALTRRPLERAKRFAKALHLPEPRSPIVPLVYGSTDRAVAAEVALVARGFLGVAIRPPTVPEGTARLRLAFSAVHSVEDVDRLAEVIERP